MPAPRVSVTSSRAVVSAAERRGADRVALLAAHQIDERVLADPDARLPLVTVHALWDDAEARCGEPELAVFAALELPWGAYRVIDYLAGNGDTLGDAIQLLADNFGLVNDSVRLKVEPVSDGTWLHIGRADGVPIPHRYVDYALAASVYRMTHVTGEEVHPQVQLRRPSPMRRTGHTKAFGPDVVFGAQTDRAFFPAALWTTPSKAPDPGLREVLSSHAELLLKSLDVAQPLPDRLRAELKEGLPFGRIELSRIAKRLSMSPRTLQRRLGDLGLTWRGVVDPLRHQLACTYLRDRVLSVEEVARLVGYADVPSFHRAFVRWTGQPPGAWRLTH